MMMRILSTFLLAASIFSSCNGKSDLFKKVFCNKTLEEEMVQIERQAPEKLKRPAIECIEQNSTKSKGIEVQCIGTLKILRPHYAAILEDSVVFSGCIMKALTDVDKDLSEEEIKKVDELMKRSKKIYDKIKKLKGGSSNSTSTGSGN